MSTSPPYRMTVGHPRLADELATWGQRPALRPHTDALTDLLNHRGEILTLSADGRLIAAFYLVRDPLLAIWEESKRTEPSLMLCHLVKSPEASAERILQLVTMWATDFAARSEAQWVRGELPLPADGFSNRLLIAAGRNGWGHEKTVRASDGQLALMQCKAEPRPGLSLFLGCEVPDSPVVRKAVRP
ncbi:hypothetical protein ACIF8T_35640 [Streptomyces sp. NPDC085946]|uniref:hypothetical protein n=1 Tax=Streptomyces sp. NPDC085946 TaxID=3365744 RepID=UPI0037CF77D9